MGKKIKVCPICGCTKEIFGREMKLYCPWCDEEAIVKLATASLRRSSKKIELGLVRK